MIKLAGVVVIYNPSDNILNSIASYNNFVEELYVIDNSENKNVELVNKIKSQFKNIVYVANPSNLGIAKALNMGAELAVKKGYSWLLTMDQDSFVNSDMIRILCEFIEHNENQRIGMVSPFHLCVEKDKPSTEEINQKVLTTMTSGSILNLKAYKEIGPFIDEFFIDCVDTEYCLRLNKNNYRVFKLHNAVMKHSLGRAKTHNFLFFKANCTHHSAFRRYYIIRNRWLVMDMYKSMFPSFILHGLKYTLKELLFVILLEDDKFNKLKCMFKGFVDYLKMRKKYKL